MITNAAVVALSGPRQAFRRNMQWCVATDISEIRFRRARDLAIAEGRVLLASMNDKEAERYQVMARELLAERARTEFPFIPLVGASHSLANAWQVLQFAHDHTLNHLTVVTSGWHLPRVQLLFDGVAALAREHGAHVPWIGYHPAPMSKRTKVRKFERRVMRDWQEVKKLADEPRHLARYAEALRDTPLQPNGFLLHPDRASEFVPSATNEIRYNSLLPTPTSVTAK